MSSTTPAKQASTAPKSTRKPHSRPSVKKGRIARRRGRARDEVESDDEVEREARSDSDSDDDSSLASESDYESASDDEENTGVVTPETTQTPPPVDIGGPSSTTKSDAKQTPFVGATDWAQVVADEASGGAADLPVIDFADMHAIPEPAPKVARPRKAQKPSKQPKKPSAPRHQERTPSVTTPDVADVVNTGDEPEPSSTPEPASSPKEEPHEGAHRPRGQSARQAYQQRLQVDPSFVPKVGEFWGHDDRLLDKNLRSLSGWWRGRWQRGRGGFAMHGRGGGRGGSRGGTAPVEPPQESPKARELAPIDQAWGHDGFEEMKRREDHRKREQQQRENTTPQSTPQRGAPFRGRGGFIGSRGRGGFAGGKPASPSAAPPQNNSTPTESGRVWYAMKPEKLWTKQSEGFLFMDSAYHRATPSRTVKVKVPGRPVQVVRVQRQQPTTSQPQDSTGPSASEEDKQFIVRIPTQSTKRAGKEVPPSAAQPGELEATTVSMEDLTIEEVFTVRPQAVPSHVPLASSQPTNATATASQEPVALPSDVPVAQPPSPTKLNFGVPDPAIQQQLEQISIPSETNAEPSARIQETVLRNPAPQPDVVAPIPQAPSALAPIQTSFSPIPQTSPPYGSPYPYSHTLPPGIAMSQQGYPYEVATGRPVYLATPPPSMYTPRPATYMGHPSASTPFVPGHMHRPSHEFVPQQHMNTFIDPSTGMPIFTPARQSSRIEIRAPTDGKANIKPPPRPSGLRTAVSESDAAAEISSEDPSNLVSANVTATDSQTQASGINMGQTYMPYAPYQAQYYYPDPNGYPAYVDMSSQVPQYDMYPPADPRGQSMIYY